MTDRYVYSGAAGAGTGADWANAFTTLAAAFAGGAAGDRFFVAHDHAESQAGALTLTCPGTLASPCQITCVDRAGSVPPVSADMRNTGSIAVTGAVNILIHGHFHWIGAGFIAGSGSNQSSIRFGGTSRNVQVFEDCDLIINNTSPNSTIECATAGARVKLINTRPKFGHVSQNLAFNGASLEIIGGAMASGTVASNYLINDNTTTPFDLKVDGFDMSNVGTSTDMIRGSSAGTVGRKVFRNCKLPASWAGALFDTSPTVAGSRGEMYNCDSGDTNYKVWVEDYCGSIKDETTLVKTGGASDGDTPLSWKMASSANAEYPLHVLRSPEIFSERITSVGASKTITVDILHDSVTNLKDDEIWLEVQYLGTSGFPLALFADDAKADVLATAADQAASSATWTTTGMSNPNKQKLEVTFTPQEKGVAIVRVCLAKASTTVRVDPVAQVS